MKRIFIITALMGTVLYGCGPDDKEEFIAVTDVILNKKMLTLAIDDEETLIATVTPTDATNKTVTWLSADTRIATVDNTGKVKAVAAGATEISVKAGNKTDVCIANVSETVIASTEGVYFVGSTHTNFSPYSWHRVMWKDGEPTKINYGNNSISLRDIFVTDKDVYIVGYKDNIGEFSIVLWKNGVGEELSNGSFAYKVFVSGDDVFVLGKDTEDNYRVWKNGIPGTPLPFPSGRSGGVSDLVVSDKGDIYVTGYQYPETGKSNNALMWKNSIPEILSTYNSNAYGLCLSGNDIYVAGYEGVDKGTRLNAVIWKNGECQIIGGNAAIYEFIAHDVFVDGEDIYVAGSRKATSSSYAIPGFWKNYSSQPFQQLLETTSSHIIPTDIVVKNGDVYICSDYLLWINGEMSRFSNILPIDEGYQLSYITGMFVK